VKTRPATNAVTRVDGGLHAGRKFVGFAFQAILICALSFLGSADGARDSCQARRSGRPPLETSCKTPVIMPARNMERFELAAAKVVQGRAADRRAIFSAAIFASAVSSAVFSSALSSSWARMASWSSFYLGKPSRDFRAPSFCSSIFFNPRRAGFLTARIPLRHRRGRGFFG